MNSTHTERRRPSQIQTELDTAQVALRRATEQIVEGEYDAFLHQGTYDDLKHAVERIKRLEEDLAEAHASPYAVCTIHGVPLQNRDNYDWFYCGACERQHGYCPACGHLN